jgi:bla regulator protein BlaR1
MLSVLIESAIRATLIAAAVGVVLRAMRIRQPALRHTLWTGVAVAMLVLPVFVVWGPRAAARVLPAAHWQTREVTRTAHNTAVPAAASSPIADIPSEITPGAEVNWQLAVVVIYLAGLAILLARLAVGVWRVRVLVRQAVPRNGVLTHPSCAAPVTVGCFRPAVILPASSRRWPAGQLGAILIHEREHVRRRDPLIQCIALVNRAVFWFHPLAWWLEREIARLAEEACDAAVISHGYPRKEYAEYLLNVARSVTDAGARLTVLGAAAVGSGLAARIRTLLLSPAMRPVSRFRLACVVVFCGAAAVAFTAGSVAHAQLAGPSFEVATIKLNKSGEQGGGSQLEGSTYRGTNVSLLRMIRLAYAPIQEFVGGTGWIDTERYDVVAKAEGQPNRPQMHLMLRSLLADRFKLAVHKETREKPAFALVLARPDGKLGPSLKRSEIDCSPANRDKAPKGACGFRAGKGILSSRSATMEMLASELILTGRIVVDRTGLTGSYDLDLRWTPDEFETSSELITALREQLGLKLEATRAPVEVIVIDNAERPSEN